MKEDTVRMWVCVTYYPDGDQWIDRETLSFYRKASIAICTENGALKWRYMRDVMNIKCEHVYVTISQTKRIGWYQDEDGQWLHACD